MCGRCRCNLHPRNIAGQYYLCWRHIKSKPDLNLQAAFCRSIDTGLRTDTATPPRGKKNKSCCWCSGDGSGADGHGLGIVDSVNIDWHVPALHQSSIHEILHSPTQDNVLDGLLVLNPANSFDNSPFVLLLGWKHRKLSECNPSWARTFG